MTGGREILKSLYDDLWTLAIIARCSAVLSPGKSGYRRGVGDPIKTKSLDISQYIVVYRSYE